MAILEDEGLVLRSLRYRETSRIVTFLTRRHGKLNVIAKGARDLKSPFGAALQPLTLSRIVFYSKISRTLQFLKAASVERAYLAILAEPAIYLLASAAAEFVLKVLPDEDPAPELFDALRGFMEACEEDPPRWGRETAFKGFQLHVVGLLGYRPQLDTCAGCGRPLESPRGFGVAEGGLLCGGCCPAGEVLAISPRALTRLRAILAGGPGAAEHASQGPLEPGSAADREAWEGALDREVTGIIESFLRFHVTGYRGLRSLRGLAEWRELDRQT